MSFDVDTLLQAETTEAGSTEFVPIPVGDYIGIIDKIDAKEVTSKKDGKIYRFFEVTYIVDDEDVRKETGLDEPRVRQSMILDLTDGSTLDLGKGKNVQLNRLREACGQNLPGKPWSFTMLQGQAVKVSVKHRPDPEDPSIQYAEVKAVAKL